MTLPQPATIVRPAHSGDILKIDRLIEPFVKQGKLLPRSVAEIEELIATSFVAESDGELVGFVMLEIYSKKLAEIRSLAVSGDQQGLGLGSQLVNACVELARQRGILEVMAVTSSDEFFLGCGFDFTLPGEKKALFIQPLAARDRARASSTKSSPS